MNRCVCGLWPSQTCSASPCHRGVAGSYQFTPTEPWHPPSFDERRADPVPPKFEDVADAIVNDYVATMQGRGHIIDEAGRAAIRRMASIHYAFYCAIKRALP